MAENKTLYELLLKDGVSSKLRTISASSSATSDHFETLKKKQNDLVGITSDLGGSMYSLKAKIDLLQQEKELLPKSNISTIKEYNKEIAKLNKEVEQLDNKGKGGAFKNFFGKLNSLTGGLALDPIAIASAGIGTAVKGAMSHWESMAKINITAQLDKQEIDDLSAEIKRITTANKADITIAPIGFEKIISQVGDVKSSLDILDAVQKGAKGGFIDMDIAAGALAQTLSIVGSANTTPLEILDTFFASKRVGAGEFADFAKYMPNLIAGASNLGIEYKEVAGVFAYMTGKGQSAEKAAVLMENAFSVLGRGEVQEGMKKLGINAFDAEGNIRSLLDIAEDMNEVFAGKSDKEKSNLLESMGLRDKEAKNSFAILTSDTDKLKMSLDQVTNSAGETNKAVELSVNPNQKAQEVWNSFKLIMLNTGEAVLPIVYIALDAVCGVLEIITPVLDVAIGFVTSFFDKLQDGNPILWGMVTAITAFALVTNFAEIAMKGAAIASAIKTGWDVLANTATAIWTGTQWGLNTALYACPLTWVALGVGILVGGILWAWDSFEGFRKVILGTWEVVKGFGNAISESVLGPIKQILSGLGLIGEAISLAFSGDFSGAWKTAKDGAKQLFEANPITIGINTTAKIADVDYSELYDKGAEKAIRKEEGKKDGLSIFDLTSKSSKDKLPVFDLTSINKIESQSENKDISNHFKDVVGGKNGNKDKITPQVDSDVLDSDNIRQAKGNTMYGAILDKLRPVAAVGFTAATLLSSSVAAPKTPSVESSLPPKENIFNSVTENRNIDQGKRIMIDRVCDNITINVANTDNAGGDQIRSEIVKILENILDDYDR